MTISRRSLQIANAKLTEVVVSDLSELPAIGSRLRGDLWFCCLGTTIKSAGSRENFAKVDRAAVVATAKIARGHAAKSFTLVSAMGANAKSMIYYNQVKGQTEDDVKALGLRSLIIFRPALLVGPRREFRPGERVATWMLLPLSRVLPTRFQKLLVTDVATLAARMLAEGKVSPPGVHVISASDI